MPIQLPRSKFLGITTFASDGGSTTSVTAVNLNAGAWNYTPKSASSRLILTVSGQCSATALGSTAGYNYFWIGENTGTWVQRSAAAPLQVQQYSTTYGEQIYAPLHIQCELANNALTARAFDIMGAAWNAGVTAGASGILTITEIAN